MLHPLPMHGDRAHGTRVWALGLVLALASTAQAQEPLEALVERVVGAQLRDSRIPGATVAVVRNGQVVLTRGYGLADVEHATPVDAERTLFRVASVGKPWVWTAVMQLVEQGRLDLEADLTTYLGEDVHLAPTFPAPLTLAHLMAHTPGFEVPERLWPAGPTPDTLLDYLQRRMPARVRPPGELSAYSDYGTSLAEHIVERVSGMPFDRYLREHLQVPLGMEHSLFGRTVPPERAADVALGHTLENGSPRPWPLARVTVASSGSLLTSATDMARFMLAHLQGGQLEGHRILREETVRWMHRQHFTHDARLGGWAHGFMEFHLNGQRLLGHTGDAYLFHSLLVLLPEHGWGLFVSYNGPGEGAGAQRARMQLLQALLDRDFPWTPPPVPPAPADFALRAERFVGSYQTTWRAYTTAESSLGWRQEVRVRDGGDGTLRIQEPGSAARAWVEEAPLLFRPTESPGSPERIAFREDAPGHITHLFFENQPTAAYERVPGYASSRFTLGLLAGCALTFLGTVGAAVLRRPGAHGGLAAVGLLYLLFLAGFTGVMRHGAGLEQGTTPWDVTATLGCARLATLLLPAALAWSGTRTWKSTGGWTPRVSFLGFTLAAAAFTLWLHHWNLL